MESSVTSLGQRIKQQREQKGYSLRHLAERTRIPIKVLEDLEAGRAPQLLVERIRTSPKSAPGSEHNQINRTLEPVFVKGFIRSIATELGIKPDEMLSEYKKQFPERDRAMVVPVTARAGMAPHSPVPKIFLVVLLVVAVAGVSFLYYYPRWLTGLFNKATTNTESKDTPAPEPPAQPLAPPESSAPAETKPTPSETTPAAPTRTAAITPGSPEASRPVADPSWPRITTPSPPTQYAPARTSHELKMIFDKESWVQVIMDGGTVQQGLFGPGTSKTWTADKSFTVRVGNAGGVKIFFNGQPMGTPGPEGKAVTLTLPKTDT